MFKLLRLASLAVLALSSAEVCAQSLSTVLDQQAAKVIDLVLATPIYGALLASVLENQPSATDTCAMLDVSTTESADGQSIGVRNYGCMVTSDDYVVFSVSIPKLCATQSCGLIVDQHGATMNAAIQDSGTQLRNYGWKAMARGASTPYIVIQPNITDLVDNDSDDETTDVSSIVGQGYDDELPGVLQFVKTAIARLHIDPKRVHYHGFSRGAITAEDIYCNAATSGLFASYALTGGGMVNCAFNGKPVLVVNGETDPIDFLESNDLDAQKVAAGASATVVVQDAAWSMPILQLTPAGLVLVGRQQDTVLRWGNQVLENVNHSGATMPLAGHCLPRLTRTPGWFVCPANFDLGQKVIDFFIQHPQP